MTRPRLFLLAMALSLPSLVGGQAPSSQPPIQVPRLGVSGTDLTIDGRPAFLFGASLFDGLGKTAPGEEALDALRRWGVRIVRVWADWRHPIYRADGSVPPEGRARLEGLVRALGAHGLSLELVLLRPGQLPGQKFARLVSEAARVHAVEEITLALKAYRNVIFDLYGEHDHPDGPIGHREARRLRDAVKAIDPMRLVTISSTDRHLVDDRGRVTYDGRQNLWQEIGTDEESVGVDLVAAHLPRTPDWAVETTRRVRALKREIDRSSRPVPLYLNQEPRAAPGEPAIPPAAYLSALGGAISGGAGGWFFHTPAGDELEKRPFLSTLLPEERQALTAIGQQLGKR
jgi:hypothetical protein